MALANARRHEFATLEHLLLALIDEPDAARVMKACSVDTEDLRATLVEFIDEDLSNLVTDIDGSEAVPTAAFQRVIQRAAIHVQSSGRTEVTGANVLVAIFAERESNAAYFLQEQDMTRYDAVNFIAHGAGNLQVCTAAMEEKGSGGIGVKLIKELTDDLADYMQRHGYASIEEFRGVARERIVEHSQVRRKSDAYNGGYAKSA